MVVHVREGADSALSYLPGYRLVTAFVRCKTQYPFSKRPCLPRLLLFDEQGVGGEDRGRVRVFVSP